MSFQLYLLIIYNQYYSSLLMNFINSIYASVNSAIDNYFISSIFITKLNPMNQKPNKTFLNPDSIHPELFCSICKQVLSLPVLIQCGHSFCYSCISDRIQTRPQCPDCKINLRTFQTYINRPLINMIAGLETKCQHPSCQWIGFQMNLKQHKRNCQFRVKREQFQISVDGIIDLEAENPPPNLSKENLNGKLALNQTKKNSSFNFFDTSLPCNPTNGNFFQLTKEELIQAEYCDFKHFSEDQYDSEDDGSRGLFFNQVERQQAYHGTSRSPPFKIPASMKRSSSLSHGKPKNKVHKNQSVLDKVQRKFINAQNKELENLQQQPLKYRYKRKSVIQQNSNLKQPQDSTEAGQRSRSRDKQKRLTPSQPNPKHHPTTTKKSSKRVNIVESENSDDWTPQKN